MGLLKKASQGMTNFLLTTTRVTPHGTRSRRNRLCIADGLRSHTLRKYLNRELGSLSRTEVKKRRSVDDQIYTIEIRLQNSSASVSHEREDHDLMNNED